MEYKLISSTDASFVTTAVNEALAEGWELLGSVAVGVVPGAYIIPVVYVQSMTRNVKPAGQKESTEHTSITAAGLPDTLETLL